MPGPLAVAGAVVSIGSAIGGIAGGLSSNKKARSATRLQAKMTYRTRMEEIDRLRDEQDRVIGANRANIAASNLLETGSSKRFLDAVKSDFAHDIAWRQEAARMERRAIRKGAPGSTANWSTAARGLGQIGSTITGLYS